MAAIVADDGVDDVLRESIEATEGSIDPPTQSRSELSLEKLLQLFEAQDAAWGALPPASSQRAVAAGAAAQSASDLAWKYFDRGEMEQAASWFTRRGALRLEAYSTRKSFLNSRLEQAGAYLDAQESKLEVGWGDLKRRFPDLSALVLKQIRESGLPSRPLAYSSARGVQNILQQQQKVEKAAFQKAGVAKKFDEATRRSSRYNALGNIFIALSQANSLRTLRSSLAMQRQNMARAFDRTSDLLLFAEQDAANARVELKLAKTVGETPQVLVAQQAAVADALESTAGARATLGQTEAALAGLDQAIALRRSLPRESIESSLAAPFQTLGRVYANLGQLRPARSFYQKAVAETGRARANYLALHEEEVRAARAKGLPAPGTSDANQKVIFATNESVQLNNLATLTHQAGDIKQALALFERARLRLLEIPDSESFGPLRRSLLSTTRYNRAVTLYDAGQVEEALTELEVVARKWREAGDDMASARALLTVADYQYRNGQPARAREGATQARVLLVAAQDLPGLIAATNFLASLEREEGNLEAAGKLNQESIRFAATLGDISWQAVTLRYHAILLLAQKQPAQALQVLGHVREMEDKVGAPLTLAKTLALEGDALRDQIPAEAPANDADASARREQSIAKYKEAIALVESVRATTEESAFAEQESSYRPYQSLVALLLKAGRNEEAFDYLQRAKSKKMRDLLRLDAVKSADKGLQVLLGRVQEAEDKLRSAQAALAGEQSQRAGERDGGKIDVLKRVVASTQGEFRRLQYELRQKNPNFDRILSIDPTLLKDAQSSIPPDVALVQYAPLGEELYIFVVTRESLKVYAPRVKPDELNERIREFRRLMDQARAKFQNGESLSVEDWNTQAGVRPLRDNLTALYSMLIEPIQDEIKNKSTLAFVPTQLLYYLPLHALAHQTDKGLRFLIQDKRVSYLSSANVFVKAGAPGELGAGMVALGNPKGADLPFSGEEANRVAQVFRTAQQTAQVVSGEGATKPALLAPANLERRVWHLATHGFLNASDPMHSYIQLAPSGDASTTRLTLEEVWGLDLKRVDLVTLSACETALGERNPDGKEVTSLASSFSDAGARSVLASLWSVADDSTSTLMTGFYRSMAAGKPKAQALQEAELALLAKPETNHPFFWAPFVLMGDWR